MIYKFSVGQNEDEFTLTHSNRTRYPLALNYLGVLEVKLLQEKLKKVQLELATYRNQVFMIVMMIVCDFVIFMINIKIFVPHQQGR